MDVFLFFFSFFQPPGTEEEDVLVVLQDYPSSGVSEPTYRLGEKLRLIAQCVCFFSFIHRIKKKKKLFGFDVSQSCFFFRVRVCRRHTLQLSPLLAAFL